MMRKYIANYIVIAWNGSVASTRSLEWGESAALSLYRY
jgi:hypothetical protein